MPELIWYRSLYWRIAFGFVALLATLLVAQGLVFLWMTGSMTDLFPTRSPAQFAASMATDLGAAVAENPAVDLRAYVTEHYSRSFRSFVVALQDGTVIQSERVPPPPMLVRSARGRLLGERFGGRGGPPPIPQAGGLGQGGRGPAADDEQRPRVPRSGGPGEGGGRGSRGFRGGGPERGPGGNTEYAPILADASMVGVVAVPREAPPLSVALRDLGPILGVVALVLLVTGTSVAALVIFRPTRRRLGELQQAARAIGAGEIGIRAPESGGDEVTALSQAFNEMAGQLEERTRALEAADRTRRQLLADVSHELMTPLAAIRGYVETLGMPDLKIDEATRGRYLGIVNEEAGRLEHIIGDLLDLARIEGGGGGLRIEEVSVAQLLERVRDRHAPAIAERGIRLQTEQGPGVEGLQGDQNRLEQALQNLVANAVRHTPNGGTVNVRASADAGSVSLTVDDSGPGIPPDQLDRVFDRFYKVDESRTGTDVPSGSGLGLSIVQTIVARHGGTVTAANRPEGGARFEIRLPRVQPSSDTPR